MKNKVKAISFAGVLGAMSAILYIFPTFPILPAFSWLKIDFADAPALLASVAISPIAGGAIVATRNTIHALIFTKTAMIGELSNFLISFCFVVAVGIVSRIGKKGEFISAKKIALSLFLGAVAQVTVAVFVNRYIMIPLYGIKGDPMTYIFAGVIPFNFIKDFMICIVFALIYRFVIPRIKLYL